MSGEVIVDKLDKRHLREAREATQHTIHEMYPETNPNSFVYPFPMIEMKENTPLARALESTKI